MELTGISKHAMLCSGVPKKAFVVKSVEVPCSIYGKGIPKTMAEEILYAAFVKHKINAIPQYKLILKGKAHIVDFAIKRNKIIVECDSKYHDTATQRRKDLDRDKALWLYGWRVVRLADEKIKADVEECVAIIQDEIEVI